MRRGQGRPEPRRQALQRGALQPSAIYSGPDRLRLFAERAMTGRLGADVGQTMFKTRHSFQRWSVDALEPFMFFMLVKNVYVGDRTLRAMYAEGLTEYRALKAELDPAGLFSSRLLDRLLGERVSDP